LSKAPVVAESQHARAAVRLFRKSGGVLRMADALRAGIHRRALYQLRDAGVIEQLSRGLYRLADAPPLGNPDLVTVALRVRKGVGSTASRSASTAARRLWPTASSTATRSAWTPPSKRSVSTGSSGG
jgi:hypothetical protein